jgi:beta-lactamase class A
MAFFKKRDDGDNDEYEEDELDEPRPRKKTLKDRDFKDLKPENRKKRKEPKKPWGKKERLFVFLVLLLTVGISALLALSSRSWKLPGFPRLTIPRFSMPFFKEETIVIQGRRNDYEKSQKVINLFERETKNLSGVYGLYVIDLETGFSYGINEKEVFQAASLIKLPVIAATYIEAESGNLNLSSKYTLKTQDKVSGAGSLYAKPVGYQVTYRKLLDLMGKESDNTAFNVSRKLLGDEKVNEVIQSIGMIDTSLSENETTPKDIGNFFKELWNASLPAIESSDGGQGNIVSKESADAILVSLTDTLYEDWLVAGVPDQIRVAHKFGREVHVVNDAGVVFTNNPYVVVIMSKGVIESEADEVIPQLSRLIYESESKAN